MHDKRSIDTNKLPLQGAAHSAGSHVCEVIRRLRAKEDVQAIADWLQTKPDLRSFIERNKEMDVALVDVVERTERLYVRADSVDNSLDPAAKWTTVPVKQALIALLFERYFTWVHPYHMLFSETNFLDCYLRGDSAYCSRPLVNSICAMACHFLDRSNMESIQDTHDLIELRQAFLAEARAEIGAYEVELITTHQTFAVLFLDELSAGRARNATTYLRCAADELDMRGFGHKDEVYEASRWGIHTLNT